MNKTIVPIKGMHCRSCEILIEEKLKENPDIKNVSVSYKNNEARIYSHHPLNMGEIRSAVIDAGYEVGVNDSKSWFSKNAEDYLDIFVSALLLVALYLIGKRFGLFNINTGSGNPSSLLFVLVIGLTAGVSTCMALVGGLVLGISARHAEKHPEATPAQKFRPHLFFNLGRISSYFLLGGLVGLIGRAFQLSGTLLGILTIVVGIVMFILGLQLTEIFPRVSSGGLTLPSGIAKILGIKKHHEKEYSHANSMLVGALTFFLPCGFTQAMQLYAMSTGSFWSGALIMGTFALGTAPGLLGIGGLSSVLKGAFAKKFFKFAGLVVLVLATINISNGLNLTGWKSIFTGDSGSAAVPANDPNVKIENGVQIVQMTQLAGGYSPNQFTIRQGIPVKWVIISKSDSCASSITIPKLGIRKYLQPGENTIEFTPKDLGDLRFSCLMGMYTGKFTVIKNDLPASSIQETKPTAAPQSSLPTASTPGNVATNPADIQKISTVYIDAYKDIDPNEFTVFVNKPVKFSVDVKERAWGCMSSITIPGLVDDIFDLRPDKGPIVFEFTPTKKGTYKITCGMGVPRGKIIVT